MSSSLLAQARALVRSGAPALLALAIAPLADMAQAAPVSNSALLLTPDANGYAYFYNSSGFIDGGLSRPNNAITQTTNPDGSLKFYGTISASTQELMAHNTHLNQAGEVSYYGRDGGIALVFGGTLAEGARPGVGDYLSVHYDFSALPYMSQQGEGSVSYSVWAYLGQSQFSNSLSNGNTGSQDTNPSASGVTGDMHTDALQQYQVGDGPYYWRVAIIATGGYMNGGVGPGGNYTNYYGAMLDIPSNSIDVSYSSAALPDDPPPSTDLPEPGTALLMLAGLLPLAVRARRRRCL